MAAPMARTRSRSPQIWVAFTDGRDDHMCNIRISVMGKKMPMARACSMSEPHLLS